MKKIIFSALLAMVLMFTACTSQKPAATKGFDYKVGTASYTHTNDSYGYTEGKNGRGAVTTTIVAAVFDSNGKIVRVSIDEVESKIGIDATGQLADFTAGEVKSKKELGDAYGMKAYSSIGKEWYQQVETLEKWLEGKTANNIIGGTTAKMFVPDNSYADGYMSNSATTKATTSTASGVAGDVMDGVNSVIGEMTDGGTNSNNTNGTTYSGWTDADLKAGVTINTANIQRTIEKAWRNAK